MPRPTTLCLLAFLLAGCTSSVPPPASPEVAEADVDEPALPPALHASGTVLVGLHSLCIQDSCPSHPFELFGNTTVAVHLRWSIPANDLDFYVFDQDRNLVMEGSGIAPQAEERAVANLPPGTYSITIQAWQSGPDEYTLEVAFSKPATEA